MELRIHVSVSAMTSGLWVSVRSLSAVTCSGVSMKWLLREQMRRCEGKVGPEFDVPTNKECSSEERKMSW